MARQSFDIKKIVHFVLMLDSSSAGEAQSAFLRLREEMAKFQCNFADVIETDGYLEAITRQKKPNTQRTAKTDDRALNSLRQAYEQRAAELTICQNENAGLSRRLQDQEEMTARLLDKLRGGSRRKRVKVLVLLVGVGLLAMAGRQWWPSPDDLSPAQVKKKFEAIKRKAPQEMDKKPAAGAQGRPKKS